MTVQRRSRHAPGGHEMVDKPEAITEYHKYMGGVDEGDQLLSYCGFPHRTVKWWRRAFFFLVDAAIVNSCIARNHRGDACLMSFHIELAKELLEAGSDEVSPRPQHGPHHHPQQPLPRLTEHHFPGQFKKSSSNTQIQCCCIVCSNKKGRGKKTTTFYCKQVILYIIPCFELHHTKIDPTRYL